MRRVRGRSILRALGGVAFVGQLGGGAFVASCADADVTEVTENGPPPSMDAGVGERTDDDAGWVGDANDAGDACDASADACADPEWSLVDTGQLSGLGLSSVWGSGPNDVWAVGAKGSVIHWDGTTWASTPIETNYSLQSVYGTGPNDVWVVATSSLIYRSTGFSSGTAKFVAETPLYENAQFPSTEAPLLAVWATGPGDVWVAGKYRATKGALVETSWRTSSGDGGVTWTSVSAFGNTNVIYGIWGNGTNDVWMVGSKGATSTSFASHTGGASATDGGMPVWTEVDTATFSVLRSIHGIASNDVWAVGHTGTIRHYTGGATWDIVDSPTSQNLRGVWAAAADDVWAVGENGTVLHYDGKAWKPSTVAMPKGETRHLYAVWGSGPSDIWAVGDGVVLHYAGPKHGTRGGAK